MTISSVTVIGERISTAKKDSKIVVFQKGNKLDAVFEHTATTMQRLHTDDNYIGSFYGHAGAKDFKSLVANINK